MKRAVRTSVIGLGFMLSLAGCMHTPTGMSEKGVNRDIHSEEAEMQITDKLEPIAEPSVQGPMMVFGVKSFGCTKPSDFRISDRVDGERCLIEIVREKPDFCKKAPSIRTMRVEWSASDECVGLPVEFGNPLLK